MKTRLRLQRNHQDELPATAHAAANDLSPAQVHSPVGGILQMQRTYGNAYLQRYLGALRTGKPAHGLISRDTPNNGNPNSNPNEMAAGQPSCYLTLSDSSGKAIRGGSKRKGHEGQVECLAFQRQDTENAKRQRHMQEVKTKNTRVAGADVVTSDEEMHFTITKSVDDVSPNLSALATSGKTISARFEFVKTDRDGRETTYLTVELHNAMVVSTQVGSGGPDNPMPLETIGFLANESSTTIPDEAK